MKYIDFHCDTLLRMHATGERLASNSLHISLEKLERGGCAAQFFAMFISTERDKAPLQTCLSLIDLFYRELEENRERVAFAGNTEDLERNSREGKISAFLTIEDSGVIDGRPDNLRLMHRLGVRLVTLTWNYKNRVGSPNIDERLGAEGLTGEGREFVAEMERLGMLVDVSHLSDGGFYDVAETLRGPFLASHSNARAVAPHRRNLTDEMIRLLGERGGVAGLNFYERFVGEGSPALPEALVRHARRIYQVGGPDVPAIGTDFDGIDAGIQGIEDAGRMEVLYDALRAGGFAPSEVEKIFYKNAFRLCREVLG